MKLHIHKAREVYLSEWQGHTIFSICHLIEIAKINLNITASIYLILLT